MSQLMEGENVEAKKDNPAISPPTIVTERKPYLFDRALAIGPAPKFHIKTTIIDKDNNKDNNQ